MQNFQGSSSLKILFSVFTFYKKKIPLYNLYVKDVI